ncbi:hypothetical protein RI543_001113 [Arxiozyma heterogenica]|uniref:Uncharacterized protein n=1 Tax=Arxiozyma heterogenica TaxID=278026 RepID=A0AAN7WTR9_9SACH|nr:hypothetical protein RI543_001113 [Kazachstania heterogenica]
MIIVVLIHDMHYPKPNIIPIPEGLETFIQNQTGSALRQCHVIVGDYQGGYPLVALFVPLNEVPRCLIKEFLEKTTNLGYSFEFITIDMDRRIIAAIPKIKRLGPQCIHFYKTTKYFTWNDIGNLSKLDLGKIPQAAGIKLSRLSCIPEF